MSNLKTRHIITAAIIYFVLLFLMFFSLAHHPGQIKELVGIPAVMPNLHIYFFNLIGLVSALFIRADAFALLHVDKLPFLDVFSSAMFVLGIYYYIKRLPRRSSLIYLSSLVLLILVLPLSPNYQWFMAILLPFIYLGIISGIAELLGRWFAYFPRNPFMRNFGVILIVTAIGFSCYYHLNNYYIAWPNTPATESAYASCAAVEPASTRLQQIGCNLP